MAYASVTYTSASGTTFALTNSSGDPITYIRQSDIKVYVNNVLKTLTTDYTFNSAGTSIVLNSAVSGATVFIQRVTDISDPTVVYTAGSTLTATDLNNADNQIRYGLQELQDSINAGGGVPDGDKGDITVTTNGTVWTIDRQLWPTKQYLTSGTSATYTPTSGTKAIFVEIWGAGGGGGGVSNALSSGNGGVGGAGGGGGYVNVLITNMSQTFTYTIGAGGTSGSGVGGGAGGTGGSTTFSGSVSGAFIASGGLGGSGVAASTSQSIGVAGGGGVAIAGTFGLTGSTGTNGYSSADTIIIYSVSGAAAGLGGAQSNKTVNSAGVSGNRGAGGTGGLVSNASGSRSGGLGGSGLIIVTEYF
jgi:hypothetical protein